MTSLGVKREFTKVAVKHKAPTKRVQHFIKHHTTFVAHCCMLFNRV